MKIYVTQGHEEGIGLEVFLKSTLLLSRSEVEKITLIAYRQAVHETLLSLQYPFVLHDNSLDLSGVSLSVIWLETIHISQSFTALELGMKLSETGGILYTLPTSKDQFPGFAGHTEYFRHVYHRPDIGMFFSSPDMQMLLVTDHVPVKDLSKTLTEDRIMKSVSTALATLNSWDWPISRVFVAGLNPHAGEKGLIGQEDIRVEKAIKRIQDKIKIPITGPFPADTMFKEKKGPHDLLVYLYHDQGLGLFKGLNGFIGSNISLGLPFPRFSPDHGTSFSLYAKNAADFRGCLFSLKQALDLLGRMSCGQNSSHKSKSTQSKKR